MGPVIRPRALVLALAIALALPAALAQPPVPTAAADVLRPVLGPAVPAAQGPAENETGQDLHREDIRVAMIVDVVNVEYEVLGILFGGGKVAADATVDVHLEFRAVSGARLDEALRATTGDANASLERTFGYPSNGSAITAEEVRTIGGGALLEAFQTYQADQTKKLVEATLPGLTLLSVSVDWSNTAPMGYLSGYRPPTGTPIDPATLQDQLPQPDLREPPITLDARARLNYLTRVSLGQVLGDAIQEKANGTADLDTPAQKLKKSIQANESAGLLDRTAFNLMGVTQLMAMGVPPGWRLDMTLKTPAGYTIEGATDEFVVDDAHRSVTYVLDGSVRTTAADDAGLVTLSNRYVITVTALAAALLVGTVLRLPIEMVALKLTGARRK